MSRLGCNWYTGRVYWDGQQVPITLTQARLVMLLARADGRLVTFEQLRDLAVGPGIARGNPLNDRPYRTNVRSWVKRIRRAFQSLDPSFQALTSVTSLRGRTRWVALPPEKTGYAWRELPPLPRRFTQAVHAELRA